jgi:hypothetical protein
MFGFNRQRPASPVDVIDHSNFWPDTLAEQAADRDAAIIATAEDGRDGIDREIDTWIYRWFAALAVAGMLIFIVWQLLVHA